MANQTILFTGHMIDAPDREQPRFPAEKEAAAKEKIKAAVKGKLKAALQQQKAWHLNPLQGIASAACGGDILFQESCIELGISSAIYVTLQLCEYKKTSVVFAGHNWGDRFNNLIQKLPTFFLPIIQKERGNIWEATNEWMLKEAMRGGGNNMTLIALWNGQSGDGPGSMQYLVEAVKANCGEVIIISTQNL